MAEWNPDYHAVIRKRNKLLKDYKSDRKLVTAAKIYYEANPVEWISTWLNTYDPRSKPATMPFVLFPKQVEFVEFVYTMIEHQESFLVEKARDVGASYLACAISVHLFLFREGTSIGFGSRKEALVDKLGDMDSIFEKMRSMLRGVPRFFLPEGFGDDSMTYMKIIGSNGASITGEAGTNIGRGGRSLLFWKDESAHYQQPELIEASLSANTNIQADISSVNGLGNVFHRRREAGVDWTGEVHKGRTHVFTFSWEDHPLKGADWYNERKAKAEAEGMAHIFAQEVDRNYAASVEGILIPADWVKSAIDAHKKLDFDDDGGYCAGLDVADEGSDTNAQALRKGVVLRSIDEWSERDTGATARRSVSQLEELTGGVSVQYDCIGVGAGVKAEINRLNDEGLLPRGLEYVPWNAGAGVENPDDHVVIDENGLPDRESPINKDFYTNLKAQAGWQLRLRFERTHKAVTEGIEYDSDDLISIDSSIPLLRKLQKELSQSTVGKGAKLKLLINKTPDGTNSPNLADAVSMCYFPLEQDGYTFSGML